MKSSSQEDPKVNALESQVKQLNSELEKLKTKNADTSKELAAAKERSTKFWKATKRLKAELEEAKKVATAVVALHHLLHHQKLRQLRIRRMKPQR